MINKKLTELYQNKWKNLLFNAKDTKASSPLLIKVSDEYKNADIRVMIVGQETDGWYGLLENNKYTIEELQEKYFSYLYLNTKKINRPFWNRKNFKYFQEELTKKFENKNVSLIWSNISKIGNDGRGRAVSKIRRLEKNYFNIFEDELKILNPNIIIFTTGNRDVPLNHDEIESVHKKPVSEIKFQKYPNILAIRTYHPNAKIKGGKKHFKKEIMDIITARYNKT